MSEAFIFAKAGRGPTRQADLASSALPRLPSSLQWRYRLAVRSAVHPPLTLHSLAVPTPTPTPRSLIVF